MRKKKRLRSWLSGMKNSNFEMGIEEYFLVLITIFCFCHTHASDIADLQIEIVEVGFAAHFADVFCFALLSTRVET